VAHFTLEWMAHFRSESVAQFGVEWVAHFGSEYAGEFERGLIRERSREGREKAKERGVQFGARPKLSSEDIDLLLKDFESPGLSKPEIAQIYGISTSSVYRLYYENKEQLEVA
jgi:DNA invertase Pin-like site-specific DNA recombinase